MVRGMFKSRTLRRIFRRTPGMKTVLRYEERKPKGAKCGKCGADLHGIPRLRNIRMSNLPKTQKRPERPFGGVLCSACTRKQIIEKARSE